MPLREGYSDKAVESNIKMLIREGKSRDQAIEIALRKAGRSRKDAASIIKRCSANTSMDGAGLRIEPEV